MTFSLARKELLNNLLTARFAIGFLLCIVLIPFSVLINIDAYRERLGQYKIDSAAAIVFLLSFLVFVRYDVR